MIQVRQLAKTFKGSVALAGVDLEVQRGTVLGVAGTNGSGRTTLLDILATLVMPTSGEVSIDGLDAIENPLLVRRKIGYVRQTFGLYEELTVREHFEFIASSRPLAPQKRAEAVDAALALTLLGSDRPIRQLSRGLRQRIAVANALMHAPPVLLLDEPVNHLDSAVRKRIVERLSDLKTKGTSMLIVCNTPDEMVDLFDRIAFFHQGRLLDVRDADPEERDFHFLKDL